ncbi:MAG: NAD-dependent dehydratase, partial [Chloroflexota bacterium]
MTTLVTGATGFIGSHVVRRLNKRGIRPRVLVRPTSNRVNLADLEIEIVEGDLLDPPSLIRALDGCEQLYHVAGYVSPRPSDRQRLFDSNVRGTINIMDAARETGVSRITYLGSTTGIGASEGPHPIDENAPYNLGGTGAAYFESKREAELAMRERIEAGLPVVSIYPGYCLGPGDVYLSSSLIVTAFCKGQIFFAPTGGMAFLDVRDAAEAIVLGMEKGRVGERYFAGGHNLTYREFFERLAEMIGRKP